VANNGAAYSPEYAFEFGLQRVLDGIAVVVEQRSGPPRAVRRRPVAGRPARPRR
jgi:hypothetical protein